MPPTISDYPATAIPPALLTRLAAHLPFSLPVLRRLQSALRGGGGGTSTPHSHILYVRDDDNEGPFAAAYVDLSRGPETECWAYSTLQDAVPRITDPTSETALPPAAGLAPDVARRSEELLLALLRRVRALEAAYAGAGAGAGHRAGQVRVGALHETVRRALLAAGVVVRRTDVVPPAGREWVFYATWLIRAEDVRGGKSGGLLPEGLRWDVLRAGDMELVKSRTAIPKRDDTMLAVPSAVIRREDGTAIAWGYLGLDGSVSTLHVEEPYRGRGLAKALTGRLLSHHLQELGDDGWCSTDISTTNLQSQGVFRSIGAKPAWTVSWLYLDLTTVGEPL